MKKLFPLIALAILLSTCAGSDFPALSKQFPTIDNFPRELHFTIKDLPAPIETDLLPGIVRPIGQVPISGNTTMLLSNNYQDGGPPEGDLFGYIFVDGKLKRTIEVASEFSTSYRYSELTEDLVLVSTYDIYDTGDEVTIMDTVHLKWIAKEFE